MKWWRKLRRNWPHYRVTRAGLLYFSATLFVMLAAFLSGNNLLFLILAAMISTLGISGFVSKLGLSGLEIDLLLPDHIPARRKVRGAVRIKNLKRWVPSFSIDVESSPDSGIESSLYFPLVPSGATLEEPIDLYFPKRGAWRERTFQFTTRFPFGFGERRQFVTTRHEVLVYPCLDARPGFEELLASVSGELESHQRGRGNDFYRIRPYEILESARHVDWKATAHTGALQVREFARDEDQRVLIELDLAIAGAETEWFEAAVDCAAFLAYRLNLRGARVRLRSQEIDISLPRDGDIHTILKYLALVAPKMGAPGELQGDSGYYRIVLTPDPNRVCDSPGGGAGGMRILGPEAFPMEPERPSQRST